MRRSLFGVLLDSFVFAREFHVELFTFFSKKIVLGNFFDFLIRCDHHGRC